MRPRRDPIRRSALAAILTAIAPATGCIHHHYYTALPAGSMPVCPDGVSGSVPAAVVSNSPGASCDVPDGSTAVATSPGRTRAVVIPPPRGSTVVISEPVTVPPGSLARAPKGWRRPDPDGMATIRVEGDQKGDDPVIRR